MTQQGEIAGEGKCLTITETLEARPIGSTQAEWAKQVEQKDHDVVLVFKTIESARTLQDELGEMIAVWSRESNPKVTTPERKNKAV